jgi:6-phosphofructokinase 1
VAEAVTTEHGEPVTTAHVGGKATYGGIGHYVSDRLAALTGAETRVTVLGHLQRGAPPDPRDRIIAQAFGVHAVDLIAAGKFDRMVAWQNRRVVDVPILEAIERYQAVDPEGTLVQTARGLGISFGD